MAEKKKPDLKTILPNNFIWFLVGAFMIALLAQNFLDTRRANVGFSYQLEHLVNLDLLKPDQSKKTAMHDKLVTFTGQFRERQTDEGNNRFKYLSLLNQRQQIERAQELTTEKLSLDKQKVEAAADLFLHLSGIPLPKNGYPIFEDVYNPYDSVDHSLVITQISNRPIISVPDLQSRLASFSNSSMDKDLLLFGSSLSEVLALFRSPTLGIGSEPLKKTLRDLTDQMESIQKEGTSNALRIAVYQQVITSLKEVVSVLNLPQGRIRLEPLRSVRNYTESVVEFEQLSMRLDDVNAKLERAQKPLAEAIWFYNGKEISTRTLEKENYENFSRWFSRAKSEWDAFESNHGGFFTTPDQPLNIVLEKKFKSEQQAPNYFSYFLTFLPVLMVILFLYYVFSRQMKGMGNNAMNFGKSPAKLMTSDKNKVTFKDVAGVDEALEELEEIVDFLKNPEKFTALGGHIPKGVLCIGPPGTGKTLIAKAVAGEADRPFFSISGSDFVEMFVGVGASRIRDMFDQAKKQAPCIIFIDEIDAVGRHRGAGIGGGHDEREQTLNQLLVEMDGFDTNDGVILIAATNRPDVLDKALLRPGRFDRRVTINLPDIKGRFEILKVHAKKIKMDDTVNLNSLARSTPGASGADLENILNEAALIAARLEKSAVTDADVREARDKVLYGKERRSMEMDQNEKLTTAYHESGHTIVGLVVEHSDPIDKVTIIPRGMSLGATHFLPEKNRHSYWKKELLDTLAVLMGGRCAEEVFVSDISSGARQDIEQATSIARSMVCEWGMSESLGAVTYDERQDGGQHLGMMNYHEKRYSEETAQLIDKEVKKILDEANNRAHQIIHDHKEQLEFMTQMLMEFETLTGKDIEQIYEGSFDPDEKKKQLKIDKNESKKPKVKKRKAKKIDSPPQTEQIPLSNES